MEGGDQISQIKKRIRTKRERPSSPFISSTAVTSTSSSSNRESSSSPSPADDYNSTVTDSSVPAAAAVASSAATDWGEEEEEDDMVAICLIMLAHGSGPPTRTTRVKPIPPKKPETNDTINPNNNLFIYECKTCNRTFSTFQALGGHRASHKRPKITAAAAEEKPKPTEQGQNGQFTVITGIPTNNTVVVNKVNKIHECSICGSEFTSGQALGGHMRRHRAVATAERRNNDQAGTGAGNKDGSRKYLPLDLNLPAPEEDLRETKFQAGIVFSAPALVDCHY